MSMELETRQSAPLRLVRALKHRRHNKSRNAHSERRRARFEVEFRASFDTRFGKRERFGQRSPSHLTG